MHDKSSYSKKPDISEGLQNFINVMVEEIVLKGEAFDEQKKKWLKKYSEAEGLNYIELEENLNDFLELLPEYLITNTQAVKRITEAKARNCYIGDEVIKGIVDKKTRDIQKEKERIEKEQALAEANRREQEEKARVELERKQKEEQLKRINEEARKNAEEDRLLKEKQRQEGIIAETKRRNEEQRIRKEEEIRLQKEKEQFAEQMKQEEQSRIRAELELLRKKKEDEQGKDLIVYASVFFFIINLVLSYLVALTHHIEGFENPILFALITNLIFFPMILGIPTLILKKKVLDRYFHIFLFTGVILEFVVLLFNY